MEYSLLGSSDISISRIGLGTVKFGRNQGVRYPQQFELPSDEHIYKLLSYARELGINFLDTAPAYGTSEERLGKVLKTHRHEWVLCTKVGEEFFNGESFFDFSPSAIRNSIERSLKKLNTDFLDIVLVHSNGEDKKIIEEEAVFETLAAIKKSGLIRAFGMSTKTVEGGLLALELSDVVMVTYNLNHTEEKPVITQGFLQKKGVLIKKGLMSGHLSNIAEKNPVSSALQFVLQEPGVNSVIVGTLNEEHLKDICAVIPHRYID